MTSVGASSGGVGGSAVVLLARDIKLSHTVFALPFALLAMVLAAGWAGRLPGGGEIVLILLCMVTARTFAMSVNRLADRGIDAGNLRTAGRVLPSGRVSPAFVGGAIAVCAVGFVASAAGFLVLRGNPWPIVLSPLVLAYLAGYSYTKRFTALCHVYLGTALAMSPVAAAIAIEPAFLTQPTVWLLAAMVTCWVAGFDVIYALQDVAVDREAGLHSLPSRLGVEPALWVSRLLHAGAVALLLVLPSLSPQLGLWFTAAAGATAGLLVLEHALVWHSATHRIHLAFFTLNGVISLLLGLGGIVDVVV